MPRKSSRIILTCQQCGNTFTSKSYPSRALTGRGKYCSKPCYFDSKKLYEIDAWKHVDQSGGVSACWEWQGTMTAYGYGQFKCQSGLWRAHRLTFTLTNGSIPGGMIVRHKCDNRRCCNPDHLELGNHNDNMKDATIRNRMASGDRSHARAHPERMPRGEGHPNAKITSDNVTEIRRMCSERIPVDRIANKFGIGRTSVRNIANRRTWRHVD